MPEQVSNIYNSASDHNLDEALSLERFSRYLSWANGDREEAFKLYALNTAVSEALYTPIQMLEVSFRNRFHFTLSAGHGENWFDIPGFLCVTHQIEQLAKAREDLQREKKLETPGRIVAALTFGFWTALLNKEYENLWQTTLHNAAQREDGKGLTRKNLAGPLTPIRTLRNRVAHHEPIIMWDLPKHYGNILQLTQWLSPTAAEWSRHHSRFPQVYPSTPIQLAKGTSPC